MTNKEIKQSKKETTEAILAFIPTKDIKVAKLYLERLYNLGALEVLDKLS